jgi:hypothetical protein
MGETEVWLIQPESLRALLIAHADLGERIVRALILRRVGLMSLNSGGPVLVAPRGHGRLHALQSFCPPMATRMKRSIPNTARRLQPCWRTTSPSRKSCRWWSAPMAWSRKTPAWSISAAAWACCPSSIATRYGM